MFDRYVVREGSRHTYSTVEVNEHRAPTDASVRLLNEMQEKARENLVDSFSVCDNAFKGEILVFRDHFSNEFVVYFVFSINGNKYKFEERIFTFDNNLLELKDKFYRHATNAIYENLVGTFHKDEEHDCWRT